MNIALFLTSLTACLAFGAVSGQWFAALVTWFVLDSLLSMSFGAKRSSCRVNSLGTLTSALIIQRALDLVFTKRPLLSSVTLNLNADQVLFNQTVTTRKFSLPAVNNFNTGAGAKTDTDVNVTMNLFKECHYAFTPQEYSGTNRNLVDEAAEPIAVAIANWFVDQIASLWTAGNFARNTAVGAGWSYVNTLLPVRQALIGAGVPDGSNWFFTVRETVYASFLADPLLVAWLNNQANGNAIATGMAPAAAGLKLSEYPNLSTAAGAANTVGFAGSKDSTILVARVPKDPREVLPNSPFPGNIGIVTNERTGLSVMVNEWIDPQTLNANVRLVWMAGVAAGNTNNGQRLTLV